MSRDSFAAAQSRILERQAARQAEAATSRIATQVAIADSPIGRLPFPLNRTAEPLFSLWDTLLRSEGTRPTFRVGQVDAELLDEELLALFRTQVGEGVKYFGSYLQDEWSKEITLALRAVLFKLSIWDHDASYGASLQNLRFTDARKKGQGLPRPTRAQKSLYGLITVFGRYGWEKWEDWLVEQEAGYTAPSQTIQSLSRLTDRLTTAHSIASFASFVIFLINGRYRTLTDRLLRLRLVPPMSQISREVSFEYLNRQLVWHAFTEFLLFLLPLVGISRWRRWIARVWKRTKAALQPETEDIEEKVKKGPLAFLPERTCAICYQDQTTSASEVEVLGTNTNAGAGILGSATTDVVNPYETIPCGCIYCFVCIATKLEAEEGSGWACLRCGDLVYKCKPWSGDILPVRKSKNVGGKNVGFVVEEHEEVTNDPDDGTTRVEDNGNEKYPSDLGSSQWTFEGDDRAEHGTEN